MCGISGIWHFKNKVNQQIIKPFNNALKHRGPDGEGYYFDNESNLSLGHRRLSILDLSDRGRQPMNYLNGRYCITYNGELFNFIELKEELQRKGYTFFSNTDTEIIPAAYDYWGIDCLNKFNGMWAFAIWDRKSKSLFLARDRFGVKPIFYLHQPGSMFAFASETIAFKYLPGYVRKINKSNLAAAIKDSFLLEGSGHTIFQDIFQIMPGHCM